MDAGKGQQQSGNDKDMQREESRQGRAGDDRATPSMRFTSGPPRIGTRLTIDAPMPRPQYAS